MSMRAGIKIAGLLAGAADKTFQQVVLEGFAILAAEVDQLREEFEAWPTPPPRTPPEEHDGERGVVPLPGAVEGP